MADRLRHIPIAFALLLQTGCAGFRTCSDAGWGADKAKHFVAAAAIGASGAALASARFDAEESAALGWSAAMLAGTGKEGCDLYIRKTCWSWRDLFWDFLGASAGAGLVWALD